MYQILDKPREGILHSHNTATITYENFHIAINMDNGKVEIWSGTHYIDFWVTEPIAGDNVFKVIAEVLPLVNQKWDEFLS